LCRCTGFTYISEDSSEITFLLVENYQLTALVGLRIGKEFFEHNKHHFVISFSSGWFCLTARPWRRSRGVWVR
jgi:hypothetical protein